jgi:hypothetical protein
MKLRSTEFAVVSHTSCLPEDLLIYFAAYNRDGSEFIKTKPCIQNHV